MPGKRLFQLSEQQLDARRRGLEQYLEKGDGANCLLFGVIICRNVMTTELNASLKLETGKSCSGSGNLISLLSLSECENRRRLDSED